VWLETYYRISIYNAHKHIPDFIIGKFPQTSPAQHERVN